jgi:hypothetical protein
MSKLCCPRCDEGRLSYRGLVAINTDHSNITLLFNCDECTRMPIRVRFSAQGVEWRRATR